MNPQTPMPPERGRFTTGAVPLKALLICPPLMYNSWNFVSSRDSSVFLLNSQKKKISYLKHAGHTPLPLHPLFSALCAKANQKVARFKVSALLLLLSSFGLSSIWFLNCFLSYWDDTISLTGRCVGSVRIAAPLDEPGCKAVLIKGSAVFHQDILKGVDGRVRRHRDILNSQPQSSASFMILQFQIESGNDNNIPIMPHE